MYSRVNWLCNCVTASQAIADLPEMYGSLESIQDLFIFIADLPVMFVSLESVCRFILY